MITIKDNLIALETARTGYYISVRGGLLENLHYGAKITLANPSPLQEKTDIGYGSDVVYHQDAAPLSLEHLCLELSPQQKGDYRAAALVLRMPHGGRTADFCFAGSDVLPGSVPPPGLPGACGGEETLMLRCKTREGVEAVLWYTVYPACDVITRRMEIVAPPHPAQDICIEKLMSYQLDLPAGNYALSTFTGAWARERHQTKRGLGPGMYCFGSTTGTSSQFCNPFFILEQTDATECTGDVYGFNLVYSGSHAGCVEVSPFGKTRVMAGIQPEGFCWTLAPGERFSTPEAVLTFSAAGRNGMSANLHDFVNRHIVRGKWANADRPVLFNNWEGTYFDFTEAKLLAMAKQAAKLGMELFVLDDGWFGARDSDTRGLGDYHVNRKKLPGGLSGLAEKLRALGLDFGLWMEPEMVNADSVLYRAHPDWIVATPGIDPSEGRHQFVLDLCRSEVQDYLIEQINTTLQSARIQYVKWDMNRHISDQYSAALSEQGRFAHSYICGLYRVLDAVVRANPDVLFEGCASGGDRFDLGILCYMPQIWTSDDTDAYERQKIQTGTSYGYPQSTMGCHVSAAPNHQTARRSPLDTRFDVAAFGVLGYELDPTQLSAAEKASVAAQVAYYKQRRRLFQYGRFLRLASPFSDDECVWMVVSPDARAAVLGEFMHLLTPNAARAPLRFAGLDPAVLYTVTTRAQSVNVKSFGGLINHVLPFKVNSEGLLVHLASGHYRIPCEQEAYTAYGDLLMHAGVKQKQRFTGTGYNENVRLMPDFSARLYDVCAVDDKQGQP